MTTMRLLLFLLIYICLYLNINGKLIALVNLNNCLEKAWNYFHFKNYVNMVNVIIFIDLGGHAQSAHSLLSLRQTRD